MLVETDAPYLPVEGRSHHIHRVSFFFSLKKKWLLESPQMGEARANMKYSILIT